MKLKELYIRVTMPNLSTAIRDDMDFSMEVNAALKDRGLDKYDYRIINVTTMVIPNHGAFTQLHIAYKPQSNEEN